MNAAQIMDGIWRRTFSVSMIAALSAGLSSVSLAAEHPEHPKAGAPAVKKAVAAEHPEHPKAGTSVAKKAAAESAGALDGKSFVGELGEVGKAKGDKDEFVFQHGKFQSTACVEHGFDEAPYTAMKKGDSIAFTSKPVNAKTEKMSWRGIVKNDQLSGKATYQTEEGKTEYWFKGTLQAKKKAEHPEHPK